MGKGNNGGKGSGGKGNSGGGKPGGSKGGGWPAKTGKPSGGGRTNAPPKTKK